MAQGKRTTSPRIAKLASKQLSSPKSTPAQKRVAGSALSQREKGGRKRG